jgi:hypothetical protein
VENPAGPERNIGIFKNEELVKSVISPPLAGGD